ncbi:MAG TPA: ribosomal protein S18-alanine N-acetyltransferase [Dehalococcoidia bacterium]|nr:ribosomal protein S18-alanine N-acetyltransferase [Dehalococcoidia bacterium]
MIQYSERYLLRPMTYDDIPEVMAIERASFSAAWPRTAYEKELENRLARYLVAVRLGGPEGDRRGVRRHFGRLLARGRPRQSGEIVGFVGVWLMVDEAHIVTLAVRPDARRQGVGELLVLGALELAYACGMAHVTLEVRASNDAAQKLYERCGFRRVGVRVLYYTDNNEDAVVMTTPPLDDPDFRALFERLRIGHARRFGPVRQGPATDRR